MGGARRLVRGVAAAEGALAQKVDLGEELDRGHEARALVFAELEQVAVAGDDEVGAPLERGLDHVVVVRVGSNHIDGSHWFNPGGDFT